MLRIVYEATTQIDARKVVQIDEIRGQLTIKIHADASMDQAAEALTREVHDFLTKNTWFQIWRGRIISADSPDHPLAVKYEVDDLIDRMKLVEIRETCGLVTYHMARTSSIRLLVHALNRALECFLAGGQWFQYWEGEIVTIDSPDRIKVGSAS
ncbi:hypothetical protein [Streptomyces californicus]|uniref:hypothetical protein n=1 Tax=Streptomyces californicus TaxID=67351 RepID=UPI003327F739